MQPSPKFARNRSLKCRKKRAQEDHTHVTAIHTLVLETLSAQHLKIEELKQMVATMQGQSYQPRPLPERVDLRSLHPRGDTRFEAGDTHQRISHLQNPSKAGVE